MKERKQSSVTCIAIMSLLPSQIIKSILKPTNSLAIAAWKSSLTDYQLYRLSQVKPLITPTAVAPDLKFKNNILRLINLYQGYRKLDISQYRIQPILSNQYEQRQLPSPPASLDEIYSYTLKLSSIPDFELTNTNQHTKKKLLNTIKNDAGNKDPNLIKLFLIDEILHNDPDNKILSYFRHLDYDTDTHYLLCLLYFTNPNGLDKLGRLNQILNILTNFQTHSLNDQQDWQFLTDMITSNIFSFKTGYPMDKCSTFIFEKLTNLINDVEKAYFDYDLIGMLRCLRNSELGYEDQLLGTVKFNIGYYRYLILERAINEWNEDLLTAETWDKYKFQNQWEIVWKLYYDSNAITALPPGGATFRRKVKTIVGLL